MDGGSQRRSAGESAVDWWSGPAPCDKIPQLRGGVVARESEPPSRPDAVAFPVRCEFNLSPQEGRPTASPVPRNRVATGATVPCSLPVDGRRDV